MGEVVRAFFEGDLLTDFDSVYFFDGNTVRQNQAVGQPPPVRHALGQRRGPLRHDRTASPTPESAASFGITDNRGHFWSARAAVEILPTRTGVAILVRGVRQNLQTAAAPAPTTPTSSRSPSPRTSRSSA